MKMKKIKPYFMHIIVSFIVLTLVVGFFLPFPKQINLQATCREISSDNATVREGDAIIQGVRYRYIFRKDKVVFTTFQIMDENLLHGSNTYTQYKGNGLFQDFGTIFTVMVAPKEPEYAFYSVTMYLDKAQQWCYVSLSDMFTDAYHRYVVSDTHNETDVLGLIKQCYPQFAA